MFPKRAGLIIWVNDTKAAKNLERFGNLQYISQRMKYVLLYVNQEEVKGKTSYIEKLHFVKKVERSYRSEIRMDFNQKSLV